MKFRRLAASLLCATLIFSTCAEPAAVRAAETGANAVSEEGNDAAAVSIQDTEAAAPEKTADVEAVSAVEDAEKIISADSSAGDYEISYDMGIPSEEKPAEASALRFRAFTEDEFKTAWTDDTSKELCETWGTTAFEDVQIYDDSWYPVLSAPQPTTDDTTILDGKSKKYIDYAKVESTLLYNCDENLSMSRAVYIDPTKFIPNMKYQYNMGVTGYSSNTNLQDGYYSAIVVQIPAKCIDITDDTKKIFYSLTADGQKFNGITGEQIKASSNWKLTGDGEYYESLRVVRLDDQGLLGSSNTTGATPLHGIRFLVDWDGWDDNKKYLPTYYDIDFSGMIENKKETKIDLEPVSTVASLGMEQLVTLNVQKEDITLDYAVTSTSLTNGEYTANVKATGNLAYIKGFTDFSTNTALQNGNYVAIHIPVSNEVRDFIEKNYEVPKSDTNYVLQLIDGSNSNTKTSYSEAVVEGDRNNYYIDLLLHLKNPQYNDFTLIFDYDGSKTVCKGIKYVIDIQDVRLDKADTIKLVAPEIIDIERGTTAAKVKEEIKKNLKVYTQDINGKYTVQVSGDNIGWTTPKGTSPNYTLSLVQPDALNPPTYNPRTQELDDSELKTISTVTGNPLELYVKVEDGQSSSKSEVIKIKINIIPQNGDLRYHANCTDGIKTGIQTCAPVVVMQDEKIEQLQERIVKALNLEAYNSRTGKYEPVAFEKITWDSELKAENIGGYFISTTAGTSDIATVATYQSTLGKTINVCYIKNTGTESAKVPAQEATDTNRFVNNISIPKIYVVPRYLITCEDNVTITKDTSIVDVIDYIDLKVMSYNYDVYDDYIASGASGKDIVDVSFYTERVSPVYLKADDVSSGTSEYCLLELYKNNTKVADKITDTGNYESRVSLQRYNDSTHSYDTKGLVSKSPVQINASDIGHLAKVEISSKAVFSVPAYDDTTAGIANRKDALAAKLKNNFTVYNTAPNGYTVVPASMIYYKKDFDNSFTNGRYTIPVVKYYVWEITDIPNASTVGAVDEKPGEFTLSVSEYTITNVTTQVTSGAYSVTAKGTVTVTLANGKFKKEKCVLQRSNHAIEISKSAGANMLAEIKAAIVKDITIYSYENGAYDFRDIYELSDIKNLTANDVGKIYYIWKIDIQNSSSRSSYYASDADVITAFDKDKALNNKNYNAKITVNSYEVFKDTDNICKLKTSSPIDTLPASETVTAAIKIKKDGDVSVKYKVYNSTAPESDPDEYVQSVTVGKPIGTISATPAVDLTGIKTWYYKDGTKNKEWDIEKDVIAGDIELFGYSVVEPVNTKPDDSEDGYTYTMDTIPSVIYNGKAQKPAIVIHKTSKKDPKKTSVLQSKYYTVKINENNATGARISSPKNAGKYVVRVTIKNTKIDPFETSYIIKKADLSKAEYSKEIVAKKSGETTVPIIKTLNVGTAVAKLGTDFTYTLRKSTEALPIQEFTASSSAIKGGKGEYIADFKLVGTSKNFELRSTAPTGTIVVADSTVLVNSAKISAKSSVKLVKGDKNFVGFTVTIGGKKYTFNPTTDSVQWSDDDDGYYYYKFVENGKTVLYASFIGKTDRPGKVNLTITAGKDSDYYGEKVKTYTITGGKKKIKSSMLKKDGFLKELAKNANAVPYKGSCWTLEDIYHFQNPKKLGASGNQKSTPTDYTDYLNEMAKSVKAEDNKGEYGAVYGIDYTVQYKNNLNAGVATVTIKGVPGSGWSGSCTMKFHIKKIDFSKDVAGGTGDTTRITFADLGSSVSGCTKLKLNSKNNKYVLEDKTGIVYDKGTTLEEGKDYTVSYKNNKKKDSNTGEMQIIIKGKGNYVGKAEVIKLNW